MNYLGKQRQNGSGGVGVQYDSAYASVNFDWGSPINSVNIEASNQEDQDQEGDSVLSTTKTTKPFNNLESFGSINFDALGKNRSINPSFQESKTNRKEAIGKLGFWGLDARWLKFICFAAVFVVIIKMFIVTAPYANQENFLESFTYAKEKFRNFFDWADENQIQLTLNPLLCGLAVSLFSIMMVYYDSNIPGVDPPFPFSSQREGKQNRCYVHLSYMTAIASGIIVSFIMIYG